MKQQNCSLIHFPPPSTQKKNCHSFLRNCTYCYFILYMNVILLKISILQKMFDILPVVFTTSNRIFHSISKSEAM